MIRLDGKVESSLFWIQGQNRRSGCHLFAWRRKWRSLRGFRGGEEDVGESPTAMHAMGEMMMCAGIILARTASSKSQEMLCQNQQPVLTVCSQCTKRVRRQRNKIYLRAIEFWRKSKNSFQVKINDIDNLCFSVQDKPPNGRKHLCLKVPVQKTSKVREATKMISQYRKCLLKYWKAHESVTLTVSRNLIRPSTTGLSSGVMYGLRKFANASWPWSLSISSSSSKLFHGAKAGNCQPKLISVPQNSSASE